MKILFLILFQLFFCLLLFSQKSNSLNSCENCFFYCDEIPAKYPGGQVAMRNFFLANMKYPKIAKEKGIYGEVKIQYMIDSFGQLTNIKVVKTAGMVLDNEALRLVKLLKGWKPATLHGKKINWYNTQPFIFSLEDTLTKNSKN